MVNIYTLVNGEQIIGRKAGDNTLVRIEDPFYIMETQDEYGNNGMKLINVCTFSEQQYIVVDDKHIVFSIKANEKMTEYYQKLVAAYNDKDTSTMIEDSIKEMENMEETLRKVISKRFVGGSTIN